MENNNKRIKREFIPLIIALTILVVLVFALVYTIVKKPKDNSVNNNENTLILEEITIGNANYICEGKDLNKIRDDANKIYLTYEEIDNYYQGKGENPDAGEDDPDHGENEAYGDALRLKIHKITDDLAIKILDAEEIYLDSSDRKNNDYVYYDTNDTNSLKSLTIRVYLNDDSCNNILLREFSVTLPRYNSLHSREMCKQDGYKDKEICKKYVFNDNSYEEDIDILQKTTAEYDKKNKKDEKNNKSSTVIIIIVAIVIVGCLGAGYYVTTKKGRIKHE